MEHQEEVKQVTDTNVNNPEVIKQKSNLSDPLIPYPFMGIVFGFILSIILLKSNYFYNDPFGISITFFMFVGFIFGFIIGVIKDNKRVKQLSPELLTQKISTPKYLKVLGVVIVIFLSLYIFGPFLLGLF